MLTVPNCALRFIVKKTHLDSTTKRKVVIAVIEHGQSIEQAAKTLGVHRSNVYRWIDRFLSQKNVERSHNPMAGRQSKLCGKNSKKVLKLLLKPATDYGYDTDFWTTRRIAQIAKKEMGINVSRMSVHRTLTKHEQSYKTPESRYYEADTEQQRDWQKKTVPVIRRTIKKFRAILYFEDESNISLTPTVAKTWGPRGAKITKKVTGNRGSVSAISAISNDGRLLFNVHDGQKRYGAKDIVRFLTDMLAHHPKRHLVVIMDQAPCHRAKLVKNFAASSKRLHIFYLPPRSPEFNPDEKVWDHLKNQELKSHQATSTKALKSVAKRKLRKISRDERVVRGIFKRSDGASFFDSDCRI
jgi:transposase